MRTIAAAAALAAALPMAGGCAHHPAEVAAPQGLSYACADGRSLNIRYDGGDPNRMPAHLAIDGSDHALRPVPAMNGLRYEGEDGLVWTAEGDEATLAAAGAEPVRCTRVRESAAAAPDAVQESRPPGH